MKEELKPCRKCGEKKELWIISNQNEPIPWIKCHNCKHEESALTWNSRTEPPKHETVMKCFYISYIYGNGKFSYGIHKTKDEYPDLKMFEQDVKDKKKTDFVVILSCIQINNFDIENGKPEEE